jgi:serine protease Do
MTLGMIPLAAPVYADDKPAVTAPATTPEIKVDDSALPRSVGAITSFAPVVDKVGPSVVTIMARKDEKQQNSNDGSQMLRRFFGIPDEPGGNGGGDAESEALGSGVIISSNGLILTNNHVAEAGDDIRVRIGENGQEYKAKKVGNDPTSDLALLQIDAKGLPVLTFADSDKVKVGDLALAVGNPFNLTNTVTMGIVSALGRSGMGITSYENFIQTDASINPGNSGGALVDIQGRLIGINTAIFSNSGGNNGIGFAVPSNLARTVVDSLLKYGKVTRGFLGTALQPLTPDLAAQFNVPADQKGALVTDIVAGSAAEKAGLHDGDVITAVNGKAITDANALHLTVGGMTPGTRITVTYLRDSQLKNVDVTLGEQNAKGEVAEQNAPPEGKSNVLDGITVDDLKDDARSQYNVPAGIKGVLVTDVADGSVGYDAGLRKGDIILDMDRKPMTSSQVAVDEGNKIEKTARVLLHVWSNGKTEYVILKPKDA